MYARKIVWIIAIFSVVVMSVFALFDKKPFITNNKYSRKLHYGTLGVVVVIVLLIFGVADYFVFHEGFDEEKNTNIQ